METKYQEYEAVNKITHLLRYPMNLPSDYERLYQPDFIGFDPVRHYRVLLEDACLAMDHLSKASASTALVNAFNELNIDNIRDEAGVARWTSSGELEMARSVSRTEVVAHACLAYQDLQHNLPKLFQAASDEILAVGEKLAALHRAELGGDMTVGASPKTTVDFYEAQRRQDSELGIWENETRLFDGPSAPEHLHASDDLEFRYTLNEADEHDINNAKQDPALNPDLSPDDLNTQAKRVTRTLIKSRDFVVIDDFSSSKLYRAVPVDYIANKRLTKHFLGTKQECEAWVNAPPGERPVIEQKAIERIQKRVPLPSESPGGSNHIAAGVKSIMDTLKLQERQLRLFGDVPSSLQKGKSL